ncbi:MAG: NrdH-redoxin [Candidatus Moranbacteria bacterium RIFOXYA1_FULL_44_7]|nr:MAG: NrdH-redoxin [Candidatus Moranbacteria bacterium RIFOXYA1_FULL_44_7]
MTKTIIVYGTQMCPWCHKMTDWLKENGIDFEYIDVGTDREKAIEMVEKSGQMGVPVADVNGEIVVGFDMSKLKKLLNIK